MKEAMIRGIFIGGAIGVIATFAFHFNPPRAFFLGVTGGLLAGLTRYFVMKNRSK